MPTDESKTCKDFNVMDKYKAWTVEMVREDIKKNAFPFAVAMQNIQGDFNLSSVLRNSNAFSAKAMYYVGGKRKVDIRGAVGSRHYTDLQYLPTIADLATLKDGYTFIGVENNVEGCVNIRDFVYPTDKPILFLFGEEGRGLVPEVLALCQAIVFVEQFGSIRSINVSSCSAVVMVDFINKYQQLNQ